MDYQFQRGTQMSDSREREARAREEKGVSFEAYRGKKMIAKKS